MNRIKELRIQNDWTQENLADRLHTKYQTVGHYETGRRGLDVDTINKLCDIFGVTADYLLGRSDQPTPEISDEEAALVAAFRQADEDHRELVRLALKPWAQPKEKDTETAAS